MTIGLSPKVKVPALVLVGVGVALVVLGALLPDSELRTIGLTAVGSGLTGFGAGYAAGPGEVATATGPASDDTLSPEAQRELATGPAPEVEPDVAA